MEFIRGIMENNKEKTSLSKNVQLDMFDILGIEDIQHEQKKKKRRYRKRKQNNHVKQLSLFDNSKDQKDLKKSKKSNLLNVADDKKFKKSNKLKKQNQQDKQNIQNIQNIQNKKINENNANYEKPFLKNSNVSDAHVQKVQKVKNAQNVRKTKRVRKNKEHNEINEIQNFQNIQNIENNQKENERITEKTIEKAIEKTTELQDGVINKEVKEPKKKRKRNKSPKDKTRICSYHFINRKTKTIEMTLTARQIKKRFGITNIKKEIIKDLSTPIYYDRATETEYIVIEGEPADETFKTLKEYEDKDYKYSISSYGYVLRVHKSNSTLKRRREKLKIIYDKEKNKAVSIIQTRQGKKEIVLADMIIKCFYKNLPVFYEIGYINNDPLDCSCENLLIIPYKDFTEYMESKYNLGKVGFKK